MKSNVIYVLSSLVLATSVSVGEVPSSRDCATDGEREKNIEALQKAIDAKQGKFDPFQNYLNPADRPKEVPKPVVTVKDKNSGVKPVEEKPLRSIPDKEYLDQISINMINMRDKTMTVQGKVYRIGDKIVLTVENRPRVFQLAELVNGDSAIFRVDNSERLAKKSIGWQPY